MTGSALRLATYGYFGMGNIGNEGTLAAFLEYMHREHPEVELTCFASGAEAVRREHGVPAIQLMTYRADPAQHDLRATMAKGVSRFWDVPRTFALMRDVDVLVVPGTGVLETKLVKRPWGLPYWMFLAVLSCRVRGRKVALLSVGADQAAHPVTRWFYTHTARLADYCSYRDRGSRNAMQEMDGRHPLGEVFPDLAFSLPVPEDRPARPGHVVVGVMEYDGSPDLGLTPEAARRIYLERITKAITGLTDQGRSVTIVLGDVADLGLAQEVASGVATARPDLPTGMVSVSRAETMAGIIEEMAQAEVVVASRLHNVISALLLRKPAVSLGYAEKNARVMAKFGLGEFCQDIDTFDVDLLLDHVTRVQEAQPAVEPLMKEALQRFQDELAEQYGRFSRQVLVPAARVRAWRPGRQASHRYRG